MVWRQERELIIKDTIDDILAKGCAVCKLEHEVDISTTQRLDSVMS